jgi:hypothetical protein
MTSDRISATTTYVMRREEHLWNVSVLQRIHLFNLNTLALWCDCCGGGGDLVILYFQAAWRLHQDSSPCCDLFRMCNYCASIFFCIRILI